MSGFFLVRVETVDLESLRPDGYKILLELLISMRRPRVAEVGYQFAERHAGESNASFSQGMRFLRRVFALRVPRPARFVLVGVSGIAPNLAVTWLLHSLAGLNYVIAAVIATQVAIMWNFAGCELLVWHEGRRQRLRRLPPFLALNNNDLVVRLPLLALFVDGLGLGVGLATLLTLAVAAVARYLLVDRLVYRRRPKSAGGAGPEPGQANRGEQAAAAIPAALAAAGRGEPSLAGEAGS
jgi:dolichol-phosphate mannosyltransferase